MQQSPRYNRLVAGTLALFLCACAAADVQVLIYGQTAPVDPAPVVRDGRLEGSPLPIVGRLGCRFVRGDNHRLTIIAPNDTRVRLIPGSDHLLVGDDELPVPGGVRVEDGRTVCALRPLLEAIGCEVNWDPVAQTLSLASRVESVTVRADRRGCEVAIVTTLPVEGTLVSIPDPERWYVDLAGATVKLDRELSYVSAGHVRRVRWAQFQDDPPIARIVADLQGEAKVAWRPRKDLRGGSIIVGRVDGDEPVIDRPLPEITGLTAVTPNQRITRLRVSMTDPVEIKYTVERQPPRVIIEFPDAALQTEAGAVPVAGPFVASAELTGVPGQAGARLTLEMRQLIQFEVRQYDDPAAVDIIFKRERLRDKRVVIDPGHGDHDPGATDGDLKEKEVNLDVGLRTAARLIEMGAQVRLTRDDDTFVDLFERPRIAEEIGADLFVSIHCNAMPTANTGSGTETYYYTPRSMCLGQIMQASLVDALRRPDRGLKRARFVVVREATMPAVLVELMFLNDEEEHALMELPETRQTAAEAICEGLREYVEGTGTRQLTAADDS